MTNWSEGFQAEQRQTPDWKGIHAFKIIKVEESVSKASGLPMIIVTTKQSISGIESKSYIVKNDFFNSNMTELFNSLDGVEFGDFDFTHWVNQCGVAKYGKNDRGYIELKRFISAESEEAKDCTPYVEKPEDKGGIEIDDSQELPF